MEIEHFVDLAPHFVQDIGALISMGGLRIRGVYREDEMRRPL